MKEKYHYTECGLDNIYLLNGFKFVKTSRGEAITIHDIDGLHLAIGLYLTREKKDIAGNEVRFLRHEMLMSQKTLAQLLGTTEQSVHRWENQKTQIPKSSEYLLRLLYREHFHDKNGKILQALKKISDLEDAMHDAPILFKDTKKGWKSAA